MVTSADPRDPSSRRSPDDAGDEGESTQDEIVARRPTGEERLYTGEPLDTGDGVEVPAQQNVGAQRSEGGGEFPDPSTPPDPATGAPERDDED